MYKRLVASMKTNTIRLLFPPGTIHQPDIQLIGGFLLPTKWNTTLLLKQSIVLRTEDRSSFIQSIGSVWDPHKMN